MKPHISIITLGVKSVKDSTAFYKSLGLPTTESDAITFIKMPTVWMALYGLEDLAKDAGLPVDKCGFSGVTLAHNVLSREQVDKVIDEAKSIGAKVCDSPKEREWGGYSGYFKDPDGYLWEIAFNPYSPEIAIDEDI